MSTKHIDEINSYFPDSPFIVYQPGLAHIFGVNAAIILGSLMYWSGKSNNSKHKDIVYKTIDDMRRETKLSRAQQDKAIKLLKAQGVLLVKNMSIPQTRHFYINMPVLHAIIQQSNLQESDKLDSQKHEDTRADNRQTITENNRKNKTKGDSYPSRAAVAKAASEIVDLGYTPRRKRSF